MDPPTALPGEDSRTPTTPTREVPTARMARTYVPPRRRRSRSPAIRCTSASRRSLSLVIAIAVIALLIAALSLWVSARGELRDRRRDTRVVKVTCLPGFVPQPPPGTPSKIISVRAVNQGHRPVEIRSVQFVATTGVLFWPSKVAGDELPKLIGDGESVNVHFDRDAIEQAAAQEGFRLAHAAAYDADANAYAAPYPS